MKPIWKEVWIAALLGLVLPAVVLRVAIGLDTDEMQTAEQTQPIQLEQTEDGQTQEAVKIGIRLRQNDGTVLEMDMDEYLVGVVLAEMPASFELEAQKAQAVVARTYTLKATLGGGKHGDGSVCTDSTCCQAYMSQEDYRMKGGQEDAIEKVRTAVTATSGYVLTYEGELIEATYFSCSGGSTEDAVAVWGTDVPYLRATSSPGEENATHYSDTEYFTAQEFAAALGTKLAGEPKSWLGYATYTAGGGVNTMVIGDKSYKGTEIRQLLGLKSTAFTMIADDEGITVVTKGYGHRVGMSQYGADAMAASGSTYSEILAYYYRGTVLERYDSGKN